MTDRCLEADSLQKETTFALLKPNLYFGSWQPILIVDFLPSGHYDVSGWAEVLKKLSAEQVRVTVVYHEGPLCLAFLVVRG